MRRTLGWIVVVFLAIVLFAGGFAGVAGYMMVTQPVAAHSSTQYRFVVNQGDTATDVANRLQNEGLIRNAILFRALARYRHLDRGVEPGVYNLVPSMTMEQIMLKLQQGKPDLVQISVAPGLRVTQYPSRFTALANFNAQRFLETAKTGKLPDGTALWQKYWYVEQPQPNVAYAMEGYFFPATFQFYAKDDDVKVVTTMLNTLGERLCPGPAGNPDAYILDKAQCIAHAATVDPAGKISIFTAMEQHYFTNDDVMALYDTLTIASLTVREISNRSDAPGVSGVYYTRYAALTGHQPNAGDVAGMGSDPSAEYARDTDNPPQDGKWWKDLTDSGQNTDPGNPYNTEGQGHNGLPPGPIAAPEWVDITAAANPPATSNFYFVTDNCGVVFYAKTYDTFTQITNDPNFDKHKCSS